MGSSTYIRPGGPHSPHVPGGHTVAMFRYSLMAAMALAAALPLTLSTASPYPRTSHAAPAFMAAPMPLAPGSLRGATNVPCGTSSARRW